jgi:hypothetical protein
VAYNRKNGGTKQDEMEMGVDGLLGNLHWLLLHYSGLRRRPHRHVAQARPRDLSHTVSEVRKKDVSRDWTIDDLTASC